MQSVSSSLSTGFLLAVYVLCVCTLIRVASSQAQENTFQMKPSESDILNMKIRHLIRRAVQRQPTANDFSNEELASLPDKRVFCNSFGGCTNIKRLIDEENDFKLVASDSIQPMEQETAIDKRVFCNSYGGCKSFKRVSANDIKKPEMIKSKQRHLIRRLKLQPIKISRRVFCNSFGGCQN